MVSTSRGSWLTLDKWRFSYCSMWLAVQRVQFTRFLAWLLLTSGAFMALFEWCLQRLVGSPSSTNYEVPGCGAGVRPVVSADRGGGRAQGPPRRHVQALEPGAIPDFHALGRAVRPTSSWCRSAAALSSSSSPPTSPARTPAGCATRWWPAQATASTPRLHRPRQRQRQQLRPLETLSSLLSLDDWFDNLNSRVTDVQSRLLTVDPDLPLAA